MNYSLLAALSLALMYLFGPQIHKLLRRRRESVVVSFGGGLAAAYVFLQLLPEIEASHKMLFENSAYFIALVSFLFYFGTEMYLQSRTSSDSSGGRSDSTYWFHLALSWITVWLLIFALPEELADDLVLAVILSLVIGLRLLYKDYVLHAHHATAYESASRYILALAPLTAWLARTLLNPSELVVDLLIAVLIGFLFYNVFTNELPGHSNFIFRWFLAGAAVYVLLTALASVVDPI